MPGRFTALAQLGRWGLHRPWQGLKVAEPGVLVLRQVVAAHGPLGGWGYRGYSSRSQDQREEFLGGSILDVQVFVRCQTSSLGGLEARCW